MFHGDQELPSCVLFLKSGPCIGSTIHHYFYFIFDPGIGLGAPSSHGGRTFASPTYESRLRKVHCTTMPWFMHEKRLDRRHATWLVFKALIPKLLCSKQSIDSRPNSFKRRAMIRVQCPHEWSSCRVPRIQQFSCQVRWDLMNKVKNKAFGICRAWMTWT